MAKFFFEPNLPSTEIDLSIVKDHTVPSQPDDPTCGDEDFPEDDTSKGLSSLYHHVKGL
jgi:hypothetical protein